jgi:sec-independent protein translocase protein TatA
MLGKIGPLELAIIVGLIMLIFGPKQLPKLGRSIGQTIREFRGVGRELTEARDDVETELKDTKREFERASRL